MDTQGSPRSAFFLAGSREHIFFFPPPPSQAACGIFVPPPGIEHGALGSESTEILSTGLTGNSQTLILNGEY